MKIEAIASEELALEEFLFILECVYQGEDDELDDLASRSWAEREAQYRDIKSVRARDGRSTIIW
jgi:hypothetical protein